MDGGIFHSSGHRLDRPSWLDARPPFYSFPFGLVELALLGQSGGSTNPSSFAYVGVVLYGLLALSSTLICQRLLTRTALRPTFSRIVGYERIFLVVGSALIVGCFFAGQSI